MPEDGNNFECIWCQDKRATLRAARIHDIVCPKNRLRARIDLATSTAFKYAQIDGAHHKAWVLDKMVRALLGPKYDSWIRDYKRGDDGPQTYDWDEGIAP